MEHPTQPEYYSELGRLHFSPGWARPEPSMWPSPRPSFQPAVWRFADARSALDRSGDLVPAEQTERRNLIMVNPVAGNHYATTRTLVAAYQCVLPGDTARSHRHSAAALRLVIEAASGTYTVVDGARADMAPGDIVLTPAWSWHGHVNASERTGYWIDFLDVPLVQLSEAMFFEPYPDGDLEPIRATGATRLRIPARDVLGPGREARTVEIARDSMPTIGLHLIRQPAGGRLNVGKTTANTLYAVIEGSARVNVEGGAAQTLGPGDVIAIPCWHAHSIDAPLDMVLLRVSDEPLLIKLGLLRTASS
jgi:gentisate 1,2-dioxygenase